MDMNESLARAEIMHLISSWSVGCDRGDLPDWVWADDAVLLPPGGMRITGRENIMARFQSGRYTYTTRDSDVLATTDKPPIAAGSTASGEDPWFRHNLTSTLIEFKSAETAIGMTYVIIYGNDGFSGIGRYLDKYRKVDGQWRISERKTRLDLLPPGERWDQPRAMAAADRDYEASGSRW